VVDEEDRRVGVPEAIAAIVAGVAALAPSSEVSLLHCDFALRNVLCDPASRQVIGLIDFATSLIGDPTYDLAKMTWADFGRDEPRVRAALLRGRAEGAGAAVDELRLRLYESIQGLAAVAWSDRQNAGHAHAGFRRAGRSALLAALAGR